MTTKLPDRIDRQYPEIDLNALNTHREKNLIEEGRKRGRLLSRKCQCIRICLPPPFPPLKQPKREHKMRKVPRRRPNKAEGGGERRGTNLASTLNADLQLIEEERSGRKKSQSSLSLCTYLHLS